MQDLEDVVSRSEAQVFCIVTSAWLTGWADQPNDTRLTCPDSWGLTRRCLDHVNKNDLKIQRMSVSDALVDQSCMHDRSASNMQ